MFYVSQKLRPISYLHHLSCAGGMAKKRRAAELPDWRQHRHPRGPQPHHQRGAAVRLGQLHLSGQQHRGQETQRHSHCDSLWYAVLLAAVIACYTTLQRADTLFTWHFRSICLVSCTPTQVIKRPISMFPLKSDVSSLFRWMYYSKTQFTASHSKSMCTLWKEISHCVLISFKRSVAY